MDVGTEMHAKQQELSSVPSKRKALGEEMSHSIVRHNMPETNKKSVHTEQIPWLQSAKPSKPRMQSSQAPKRSKHATQQLPPEADQTGQAQPASNIQNESVEYTRSKLKESLASALEMGLNVQCKLAPSSLSIEQKESPRSEDKFVQEASAPRQSQEDAENGKSLSRHTFEGNKDAVFENDFTSDELLQGNGLTWISQPETDMPLQQEIETKEGIMDPVKDEGNTISNTKVLAYDIESELFKLFGGVNKKYKEKGRSLIFNLKDRSNPELRERVLSGDVTPHRLCSMTPEELASKELSQWRMAKAEELAQMVVLPDTDVDARRLVKKTHKGEFQVEVEQHDGFTSSATAGTVSISSPQSGVMRNESFSPPSSIGQALRDTTKDREVSVSGDDSSHGLSVGSRPSSENIRGSEQSALVLEKNVLGHINPSENDRVTNITETSIEEKSAGSPDFPTSVIPGPPNDEIVWKGTVKLNLSTSASMIAIFRCGEKTTAEGWPEKIEIKGRVKILAFEKFLKALPMSRSRTVMATHFCSWEAPQTDPPSIKEVSNSYISDGRVGFAEPMPGVELYLCPTRSKTCKMLGSVLQKDSLEALQSLTNGFIGVIVWRKHELVSMVSPKSVSPHNSKRKHNSRTSHSKTLTSNHKVPPVNPTPVATNEIEDDGDDDVPPGFGPAARHCVDDLPEFDFSRNAIPLNPNGASLPQVGPTTLHAQVGGHSVDQMRHLVNSFGNANAMFEACNNMAMPTPKNDVPEWILKPCQF